MTPKYKPTSVTLARGASKPTTVHYYIKQTPKEELIKYINEGQKRKIKQKCRNELVRRGVEIVWVDKLTE